MFKFKIILSVDYDIGGKFGHCKFTIKILKKLPKF